MATLTHTRGKAQNHHRSGNAARRPRQNRDLSQRRGNGGPGVFPGARTAGLREICAGASGGEHAADHVPHLRRVPHGAPHGIHQGAGSALPGDAASRGAEDPRTGVQHLHGGRPHAALLFSGRPGFCGRTRRRLPPNATSWASSARWGRKSALKVIAMRRKLQGPDRAGRGESHSPCFRRSGRRVEAADARRGGTIPRGGGRSSGVCQIHLRTVREGSAWQSASTWT